MTLIKKCDIKMHLAARQRKHPRLFPLVETAATMELTVADLPLEMSAPTFADDCSVGLSSSGGAVPAIAMVRTPGSCEVPKVRATRQS